MPLLFLVVTQQQLPPEGRVFALGTIVVVILLALLAFGAMIALRTIFLPRSSKPLAQSRSPEKVSDECSAWKIAAHRIEPLPSPGANDETRGLFDDDAIDFEEFDDD